jgi:hypothetical protein
MQLHLELSDADFSRIGTELREFRDLLNDLVHNFIDQHDLWSVEGCNRARSALVAARLCIDQHYEQLKGWAEHMQHSGRQMLELLKSNDFRELVFNGIAPDGTVNWAGAGIVYALREAAGELAVDGWTSIAEASKHIAERDPEQLPEKYGCSSRQQVVHESSVFDLRYFKIDGQRAPWYQKNENSKNVC